MYLHTEHASLPLPDLSARIAANLGLGTSRLNVVDFDDLYVSEEVLRMLQRMADDIVASAATPSDGPRFSAYWVEHSTELVLCASLDAMLHIARVARGHWSLRPGTCH